MAKQTTTATTILYRKFLQNIEILVVFYSAHLSKIIRRYMLAHSSVIKIYIIKEILGNICYSFIIFI